MKDGAGRTALSVPSWLVWAAALGFALSGLGSFGILDNNEGLYAEISREMLASGDWRMWVVPHLNGLPYMEKPPLLYWLTALSFALFGQSEWVVRLVPALSSLCCVGMLLRFGTALRRPQAGRLAALMFVSGVGVIAMSHVLMFDMLLTALLTAALMLAYRYLREEKIALLRWSYAFLALALLAKGFVALILYGLVIAVFMLAGARSAGGFMRAFDKWCDSRALLVFLVVAVPWHLAAALMEPIFAWLYFINEHVLRFMGMREPHDYYSGRWWYYLPRAAIYLFPWSFLLPGLFASERLADAADAGLKRFLLAAWLVPLIFFSVSSAKANYYLIVATPFAAFHLAAAIEERGFLRPLARALPGVLVAAVMLALCVALATRDGDSANAPTILELGKRQFLYLLFGGAGLLAIGAAVCAARVARIGILAYLVLPAWIAAGMVATLHAMEPVVSTRLLSRYLRNALPGRDVYVYRTFEEQSSLPFYMKRPIPIVDAHSNDLFWGNQLCVNRIIISGDAFRAALPAQPVAIVVVEQQLGNFRAAGFADLFKAQKTIGDTTVFFN